MDSAENAAPFVQSALWSAVVITATSRRAAEYYREQIEIRRRHGSLPREVLYIVAPDPNDSRVGSGTATIHPSRCT